MKKLVLFTTSLGLISLPIASLIACGSFGDFDDEKNLEKDDQDKKDIVNPKDSYTTALKDSDTLGYEIGERYDAAQLGLGSYFDKNFQFEVKDYNDLTGTLIVNVEHTQDFPAKLLRENVEIKGFKSYNAREFLDKIVQGLPSDKMLVSDLIDKPKPSELENLGLLNVDSLGIGEYFKFRKAEHFISPVKSDDVVGELVIDLKIAIANQDRTVENLIVTDLAMEDSVLKSRLGRIRQIMEKLGEKYTTTNSSQLPSQIAQRVEDAGFWDQLGIGAFPDFDEQKIKVGFKVNKRNTSDAKGQLELVITLKAEHENNSVERSKTILISGFLSLDEVQQDEDKLKVQTIKNYLENDFDKNTTLEKSLPSDVKKKFINAKNPSITLLGLTDLSEEILDGVEVSFTLGTADDQAGTLILVATIKAGNAPAVETHLLIKGFLTLEQVKDQERQQIEQELRNLLNYLEKSKHETRFGHKLPSDVGTRKQAVDFEKIGLNELPRQIKSDILVNLTIVKVDDEYGELEVEVELSKNGQKLVGRIVVRGYKKKIEFEKEREYQINAELNALINWISSNRHQTLTKKDLRPSKVGSVGETTNLTKLGLNELSSQEKEGASVGFKIVEVDDFDGEIRVELTVSKQGVRQRRNYSIIGYKTHRDEIKDLFIWIKGHYHRTSLENDLPTSVIKGRKRIQFEDLGFGKLPEERFGEYELTVEVIAVNQTKGSVDLLVSIRKAKLVEKFEHTVFGFKTSSEVLNDLQARLKWFEKNLADTIHKDKLPSEIGYLNQQLTPEMLGIKSFENTEFCQDGCPETEFTLLATDDVNGKLKVLLKLKREGVELSEEVEIKGFKTVNDELDAIINSIKNQVWTTNFRDKFPSEIGREDESISFQELGIDALPLEQTDDVEITLTILRVNDNQGITKVKVVIAKLGQTKITDFDVSGFKTTTDYNRELKDQADRLVKWIETNWQKTSKSDKLPSQIGQINQEVNFSVLGLPQIPDKIRDGFNVGIRIGKIHNKLGEIEIKISLVKSSFKLETKWRVKGFKTNVSVAGELNNLLAWIEKNHLSTSLTNTMPSDFKLATHTTLKDLGLSPLPKHLSQEVNLRITVEKTNDVTGEVSVKFVLSKNGVEVSKSLVIGGFKKVSQQLSELLELIKQRLKKVRLNLLPSQMGQKGASLSFLKFGLPELDSSERKGIKIKMLVEKTDDNAGELVVSLELIKLGEKKTSTLVLDGFLKKSTLDREAVNRLVEQIKKQNGFDSSAKEIIIKVDRNSEVYDRDVSKITIDEIKKNPLAWKILLPIISNDFEVEWSLELLTKEANKKVIVTLEVSRGEITQRVIFRIEGFKPYIEKLIETKLQELPFRLTTKLSEKSVRDFKVNQQYTFAQLGVNFPDVLDEILKFKLVVLKLDDQKGTLEIKATLWTDSTDFKKSKTIFIEGYWNEAKREKTRIKVANFYNVFKDFYRDKKIGDLSEQQVNELLVYDKVNHGSLFIGDNPRWSQGKEFSLDELKLVKKHQLLAEQIRRMDPNYKFSFEIVERPESANFQGSIRVRAVVRYVDLEIFSRAIVIGGLRSFEDYFHAQVNNWKGKIPAKIATESQGLIASLVEYADIQYKIFGLKGDNIRAKSFMEITGLDKKLPVFTFDGKYTLEVKAVFYTDSIVTKQYFNVQPSEGEFVFVIGLKGQNYDYFNQRVYDNKLHQNKRSFVKTLTGFDSIDSVNKAYESWVRKYNRDNPFDVSTNDIDNTHFMGVLKGIYGGSALPEFAYNFASSSIYEDKAKMLKYLLDKAEKQHNDHRKKMVKVDYYDAASVKKWLAAIDKQLNRDSKIYSKIPIAWDKAFDASLRPLVDQVIPYFKFRQVIDDGEGKTIMVFETGVNYRTISPKKGDLPSTWDQNPLPFNSWNQTSFNSLLTEVKSHYFHLRVPSNLREFMQNVVKLDAVKSKLFNQKLENDLGVKVLKHNTTEKNYRIEVKLPVFGATYEDGKIRNFDNEPKWERDLRAKKLLWDEQALRQLGHLVWPSFQHGEGAPGFLVSHALENLLVSKRYSHYPTKYKEHEINFTKYLGELGITIVFEKTAYHWFTHELDYNHHDYNAVIKVRPWLLYNAHSWLAYRHIPDTYINSANRPILVKSDVTWELLYKLVRN
ncbi:lipoprotein 17-related variable surface protein [Mycoplasma sp. ATU-Cv-703]|uniref:lipoprotein 17-related variable surface protein n=1 Tax=Mycoplasma sp. ATU-Cv-703 TaxID=2498595 RepID=UPI000FDD294A